MVSNNSGMIMDQKIFELGLSVETVSVYLLCTGLAESDTELKFDNLSAAWNGKEETLKSCLTELEKLNIIAKDNDNNVNEILNAAMWQL